MPRKSLEARRAYNAEWRSRNPEKRKIYNERRSPKEKAYRQAHLDQYAGYQRNARNRNPRENLVFLARGRSKKRGIECTITVADIDWVTHCPITGIELDYNTTPPGERQDCSRDAFPTLDRKDPGLGYIPGNVFVLSHKANRMKQDASLDMLQRLATYASS